MDWGGCPIKFLIWGGMDLDPASWGGLELGLKIGPVKTSSAHCIDWSLTEPPGADPAWILRCDVWALQRVDVY